MRLLRYCINITVDGCCDHEAGVPTEAVHRFHAASLARADALLFGRITFEMMESAWRWRDGKRPEWMADWMEPFSRTIDRAKKYVVSSRLDRVDWNAELLRGDLKSAVEQLKKQPGKEILCGGVTLPRALAELGLIDEYEFVVQPRIAGRGPTVLSGLTKFVNLQLVEQQAIEDGMMVLRYRAAPLSRA